jgi:hypothetical protein
LIDRGSQVALRLSGGPEVIRNEVNRPGAVG